MKLATLLVVLVLSCGAPCTTARRSRKAAKSKGLRAQPNDAPDSRAIEGLLPLWRPADTPRGAVEWVELPDGRHVELVALADRPSAFVVDDLLSAAECDRLIELAEASGIISHGP
jgi:hypothetical protein